MSKHPYLYSFLIVCALCVIFVGSIIIVTPQNPTARSHSRGGLFSKGQVAVIEIYGAIFDSYYTMAEIQDYAADDSIKAVVVRIDSPGGAVAPSQEIFEELKKLRAKKKVVVSMGTIAASGGYYIASAADHIVASKGTITGSIGVIMESFGVEKLLDAAKLETRTLKSGKFKDVGSPYKSFSETDKAYLQTFLDNMYLQFTEAVALQRNLPLDLVRNDIAQGKIYTGEQALEVGLVDSLGTLYDAIDMAKVLAKLPEDAKVIWPYNEPEPFEWIGSFAKIFSNLMDRAKIQGGNELPLWMY